MYRFVSFVILTGLAIVLIGFSLVNRSPVVVSAPFVQTGMQLPLFLVFFLGVFAGALLCGISLLIRRLRAFKSKKRTGGRQSIAGGEH